MKQYELALKIAEKSFLDKKDLAGEPYIEHLKRVASNFKNHEDEKVIAILHDLLEDCKEWNEKSLRHLFYSNVVDSIVALTKNKSEDYDSYIKRLGKDRFAKRVKIADLIDNMNLVRLNEINDNDVKRLRKYLKAYKFLTE